MLSVAAFDALYGHVRAFDDAARAHLGADLWMVTGSPVGLTTRSRKNTRVLRAFLRSAGGVDVVVTFRVERGWFRTWVVADVEVDGREYARGINSVLELKHAFDRVIVAKLVTDMERHASQIEVLVAQPREPARTLASSPGRSASVTG
jgi:hypothetical protein